MTDQPPLRTRLAAIKFLKDNSIDVDAMKNPETASLAARFELPFGDDEAVDELRH